MTSLLLLLTEIKLRVNSLINLLLLFLSRTSANPLIILNFDYLLWWSKILRGLVLWLDIVMLVVYKINLVLCNYDGSSLFVVMRLMLLRLGSGNHWRLIWLLLHKIGVRRLGSLRKFMTVFSENNLMRVVGIYVVLRRYIHLILVWRHLMNLLLMV